MINEKKRDEKKKKDIPEEEKDMCVHDMTGERKRERYDVPTHMSERK